MTKIIRNWKELALCESDTHYIEVEDNCCGHIRSRSKDGDSSYNYLSTHTFYGGHCATYLESTMRLRALGFDIIIDNWDDPLPEDLDLEEYVKMVDNLYQERLEKRARREQEELLNSVYGKTLQQFKVDIEKPRVDKNYLRRKEQNRNEPCNCGSGKKFKKCCGGI